MMSPNPGGETSFEQPPQEILLPKTGSSDPREIGGVHPVPPAEAPVADTNVAVEPQVGSEIPAAATGENQAEAQDDQSHIGQNAEERRKNIEDALDEVVHKSDSLEAESEEDFTNILVEEARRDGKSPEEQDKVKTRAEKLLERAAGLVGMTFTEFKAANKGASMETFFQLFLVFGTEGNFGGSGASELHGSLEKDSSDAYLSEIFKKGNEEDVREFFETVLERNKIENLDDLSGLIADFNVEAGKSEEAWKHLEERMGRFLLEVSGKTGEHKFPGMKRIFKRLEFANDDEQYKFFGLNEKGQGQATSEAALAEATPVEATPAPTPTPEATPTA